MTGTLTGYTHVAPKEQIYESGRESLGDTNSEESDGTESDVVERDDDTLPQIPAAEREIEGDFEYGALVFPHEVTDEYCILIASRLVENIRLADSSSHAGVLSKEWDFNIAEKEAEFRDDLRAASGIGRKRNKANRPVGL